MHMCDKYMISMLDSPLEVKIVSCLSFSLLLFLWLSDDGRAREESHFLSVGSRDGA